MKIKIARPFGGSFLEEKIPWGTYACLRTLNVNSLWVPLAVLIKDVSVSTATLCFGHFHSLVFGSPRCILGVMCFVLRFALLVGVVDRV